MENVMRKSMQMAVLGLVLIGLVGCEAAEQSAQKLAEKAEQAVVDVAREAVEETVNELNKQVDDVQQSTNEWLGKPADDAEQTEPQQPEQPQAEPVDQAATKSIEA
jgi:sensor domain CHASE-containing protein